MVKLNKSSSREELNTVLTSVQALVQGSEEKMGVTQENGPRPEGLENSENISALIDVSENPESLSIEGRVRVVSEIKTPAEQAENPDINTKTQNTINKIQTLRDKIEQGLTNVSDIKQECLELIQILHQKTENELSIIDRAYQGNNTALIEQIEFILPFLSDYMFSWDGDLLDPNLAIRYLEGFSDTNDDMFEKVQPYVFYYAKASHNFPHPIGLSEKLIEISQLNRLSEIGNCKKIVILGSQIIINLINLIKAFDKSEEEETSLKILTALTYWFMAPFSIRKDIKYPIISLLVIAPSIKKNIESLINEESWSFNNNIINNDKFIVLFLNKIKSTYNNTTEIWPNIFQALKLLGLDLKIKIDQCFMLLHLAIQHFKDVNLARYLLIECKLDPFQKTTLSKADRNHPGKINWNFATACEDLDNFFKGETQEVKTAFQELWEEYKKDYLVKEKRALTVSQSNIPRSKRKSRGMSKIEIISRIKAQQKYAVINSENSTKVKNVPLTNKPTAAVKSQPQTTEIYIDPIFNTETSKNVSYRQNYKKFEENIMKKGKQRNSVNAPEIVSKKEKKPVIRPTNLLIPPEHQKKPLLSELSELLEENNSQYKPGRADRKTFQKLDESKGKIPVRDLLGSIKQTSQSEACSRIKGRHNNLKTKQGNKGKMSTIPGSLKNNPKPIYKKNTAASIYDNLIYQLAAVGITEDDLTVSLENLTPRHLRKLKSQNNAYFSFEDFEPEKKVSEPAQNLSPTGSPPAESKDESSEEEGLYDD